MRPSEQLRFWAHELAAMARTGLEFATNDYDRDRFNRMMTIGEEMAGMTIDAEFTPERPYLADVGIASPKVGCSVAAFDDVGRVVLIKRADNGRWALPGGYAEVGSPPSINALRELHEETGFNAELERLVGGDATPPVGTPEVVRGGPGELPENMSLLQRTMLADSLLRDAPAVYQ